MTDCIQVFDSSGEAYKRSFQVFLDYTDQKQNARQWLETYLKTLPSTNVLIDAGAGSGELTAWLAPWFDKTIAVEPNPFLLEKLQRLLPAAEAVCQPMLDAQPSAQADLVMCSHTFYYVPPSLWLDHAERLLSWMQPTGRTIIVLQHHDTDCMRLLEHFCGQRFNLSLLAEMLRAKHGSRYTIEIVRNDAHVKTRDFPSTFIIAEFMLNLLPLSVPPSQAAVKSYIRSHFTPTKDGYTFSCHQDILEIRGI